MNSSLVKEHLQLNATAPISISNLISSGSKIPANHQTVPGGLRPSTKATTRVATTTVVSPGQSTAAARRALNTSNGNSALKNGISGQTILKSNHGSINATGSIAAAHSRVNSSKQRNNNQNQQYQEDEGFMRGARIAEKIQEFYHTSGSSFIPNSNTASSSKLMILNKPMTAGQVADFASSQGLVSSSNPKSRASLMSQGGPRANSGTSKLLYQ